MANHYEIIIVEANKVNEANLDADKVNKGKTLKTFRVGLNSTGGLDEPVTHYWCSWWVSDDEQEELKKDFHPDVKKYKSYMFDASTMPPHIILDLLGLKVIESQIIPTSQILKAEKTKDILPEPKIMIIYSEFVSSRSNYIPL